MKFKCQGLLTNNWKYIATFTFSLQALGPVIVTALWELNPWAVFMELWRDLYLCVISVCTVQEEPDGSAVLSWLNTYGGAFGWHLYNQLDKSNFPQKNIRSTRWWFIEKNPPIWFQPNHTTFLWSCGPEGGCAEEGFGLSKYTFGNVHLVKKNTNSSIY